jgi:hypothetical protein
MYTLLKSKTFVWLNLYLTEYDGIVIISVYMYLKKNIFRKYGFYIIENIYNCIILHSF